MANTDDHRRAEGGPLEDTALVERAKQGDVGAYATLVERHQEMAYRIAYLITGSGPEAEDAAQDAFVKAFFALPRFRAGAPFRPWLLRILANEARNRRKASGRRERLAHRLAADRPAAGPSPEAEALGALQRQALLGALGQLSEAEQQVIAYRFFLELSEAEMAEVMACPRGTVKSRLSRALAHLRDVLTIDPRGAIHFQEAGDG
jgi:RNA polymerase sigma-70 factor (ECF subfamily)